MKILRLDLIAFGPFTNVSLDLSGGQQGLHIIYGPNEAGKSSSLRALTNFLFGFDARCPDDFLHPYGSLRIGATIQNDDGTIVSAIRRKSKTSSLRDADDVEPIDETFLRKPFNNIDQDAFKIRYGLSYHDLVRGGTELVKGHGDLGESLFAAASGVNDLRKVREQLSNELNSFFTPRGINPLINKALSELKKKKDQVKELLLPTAAWREHDEACNKSKAELAEVEQHLQQLSRRKTRLDRIRQALPLLARREQLKQALAADDLKDAPMLSADFDDRLRRLTAQQEVAKSSAMEAQRELMQLNHQLAELPPAPELLASSEAIAQLQQRFGSYRKAMLDRKEREAELKKIRASARDTWRSLGRNDLDLTEAEQLRLSIEERLRIQHLGNEKKALLDAVESAAKRLESLELQVQTKEAELTGLPEAGNAERLRIACRNAQAELQLDARLAELNRNLADLEVTLELRRTRLTLWQNRTLEELSQANFPSLESVEACEVSRNTISQRIATIEAELLRAKTDADRIEVQLQALQRHQGVPSEQDLLSSRQHRDACVALVQLHLDGKPSSELDTQKILGESAGANNLGEALQQSILSSDQIADRLRREAKQVAEKAQLLARREQCEKEISALQMRLSAAQSDEEKWHQSWASHWKAANIQPLSPREMLGWLRQVEQLQQLYDEFLKLCRERSSVADLHAKQLAALSHELAACGQFINGADNSFKQMLSIANEHLTELDRTIQQRATLLRDLFSLKQQRISVKQEQGLATTRLENWQTAWIEATKRLALADNAGPSEANAVLEATTHLLSDLKEADDLQDRINGIDQDAQEFSRDVQELAQQLAAHLHNSSIEQTVAGLSDLLATARRIDAERKQLEKLRDSVVKKAESAQASLSETTALFELMCLEAGCTDAAELPAAQSRCIRRRELVTELTAKEERLAELAGGQPLESLADDARKENIDGLTLELVQIQEELSRLDVRRGELQKTIGKQEGEKERMNGDNQAALAQEEAELLVAQIQSAAQQYARLRLASVVLERSIDRYRQAHQGPVLRRASELFAELTLERFSGLRVDYNDRGQPVLVGVRAGNEQTVGVEGMSEGTCDQLYLALRLASLETDFDTRSPLPFIVDDILIKFDDDRATAALKALAQLSEKTQVIVFTHHDHVIELAKANLDEDVLFVQSLPTEKGGRKLRTLMETVNES